VRFADTAVGYVFGGIVLYSTTDGGATWQAIGDNTLSIAAVEPGPNGVFAVTGRGDKETISSN
jgi:photosystem II stability/assembly factor-like uncharacterized protein